MKEPLVTIYFTKGEITTNIKIGQTADYVPRLRKLQASSPDLLITLATLNTVASTEHYFHEMFEGSRIPGRGEWHRPTPDLLSFIEQQQPNEHTGLTQTVMGPGEAGRTQGRKNVKSGLLARNGRKAAESGQLASTRTPKSCAKGGRKNAESGLLARNGRKAAESGQFASIQARGNHVRHHVNRGIVNPACALCIAA